MHCKTQQMARHGGPINWNNWRQYFIVQILPNPPVYVKSKLKAERAGQSRMKIVKKPKTSKKDEQTEGVNAHRESWHRESTCTCWHFTWSFSHNSTNIVHKSVKKFHVEERQILPICAGFNVKYDHQYLLATVLQKILYRIWMFFRGVGGSNSSGSDQFFACKSF